MDISGRKVFWGCIFLILVTIPLWRPLLQEFLAPPGFDYLRERKSRPMDRFVIHGMKFSRSRDGIVDTTVSAAKAYGGSLGGTVISMRDVRIVLADEIRQRVWVQSDKGSYDPKKGRIVLPGTFTVVSKSARIKGEKLYYDLKTGNYRVEGGVVCDLNSA